jgi:hypothetical protein
MKIRNGFVSNSSSSSFIIAFDPKDRQDFKDVKIKLKRKVNLNPYIEKTYVNPKLEDCKEIAETYGLDERQTETLLMNILLGKTIVIGSVSTEDMDLDSIMLFYSKNDSYNESTNLILECEEP